MFISNLYFSEMKACPLLYICEEVLILMLSFDFLIWERFGDLRYVETNVGMQIVLISAISQRT